MFECRFPFELCNSQHLSLVNSYECSLPLLSYICMGSHIMKCSHYRYYFISIQDYDTNIFVESTSAVYPLLQMFIHSNQKYFRMKIPMCTNDWVRSLKRAYHAKLAYATRKHKRSLSIVLHWPAQLKSSLSIIISSASIRFLVRTNSHTLNCNYTIGLHFDSWTIKAPPMTRWHLGTKSESIFLKCLCPRRVATEQQSHFLRDNTHKALSDERWHMNSDS